MTGRDLHEVADAGEPGALGETRQPGPGTGDRGEGAEQRLRVRMPRPVPQHGGGGEFDDPPGGIFGLVSGVVAINTSPSNATPRLIHVASPGFWTGEGSYLTRQPRRVDMQAIAPTRLMHLPLSVMDQMEADEPRVVRNFAQIIMINVDTLIRIIHDLQQPDAARRIAAVLNRAGTAGGPPVPLSQSDLGAMANASRKQVNAALQQYVEDGSWSAALRITVAPSGYALPAPPTPGSA